MKMMTTIAAEPVRETKPSAISVSLFRRIADKDQTAVLECVETYGNFVWSLAKHFTNSIGEAEAAAQEIFIDIWKYAEGGFKVRTDDKSLIALIARRRLIKRLQ